MVSHKLVAILNNLVNRCNSSNAHSTSEHNNNLSNAHQHTPAATDEPEDQENGHHREIDYHKQKQKEEKYLQDLIKDNVYKKNKTGGARVKPEGCHVYNCTMRPIMEQKGERHSRFFHQLARQAGEDKKRKVCLTRKKRKVSSAREIPIVSRLATGWTTEDYMSS